MTTLTPDTTPVPHWHALPAAEVARTLDVDPRRGLAAEEVQARRERYGPNEIEQGQARTLLQRVADQFRDVVIWVLLAATVISALMGDYTDALVIIAIVILNAVMGVVQERKAEQSLAALRKLAAPTARVLRGGVTAEVPARELVPGDVVLVEAGNNVPADGRLIEAVNLRVEEASLTGESLAVEKDAAACAGEDVALGDRVSMLFASTTVTNGRGRALVVATGTHTELGQIARLLGRIEAEKTPLQEKLEGLGRGLALLTLAVCGIVFAAGMLRGLGAAAMFMTAVSLAVAAIPEGLPAVVTIVLAMGMQNMVRRNVIIRRLRAVEALGAATVICSDKTGTLTQNVMAVRRLCAGGRRGRMSGTGYAPDGELTWEDGAGDADVRALLEVAALCNDAELRERDGRWEVIGDPTEGALIAAAVRGGVTREALEHAHPRETEIPFDAERRRMTTLHLWGESYRAMVKGAPDGVLGRCSRWQRDGVVVPLRDQDREAILAANRSYAEEALRVLGFAYRDMSEPPSDVDAESVETDLVFVGLMGMIDPPRPEVLPAIAICRAAGIRPVVITGDYAVTAMAVARDLTLVEDGGRVLTGADLRRLSDTELQREVEAVAVYARVAPAEKLRLVEAFQACGHVVAMTGDGVNDAPALKRADIGVAMGITGTDVAKGAADVVLTDDNFASIVAAVEEGRGIFANIRRFVLYLLSCNISEVLSIFLTILAGLPSPLVPVQILWVNLVTDGLPALALGAEPKGPGLMERPPRAPEEGVLDREAPGEILYYGGAITLATLLAYFHGLYWHALFPAGHATLLQALSSLGDARFWAAADIRIAQTMAFVTLALSQLAHALNCRNRRVSLFRLGLFSNPRLAGAIALSALAQLAVVYVPLLQPVFRTVPIAGRDLVVMLALAGVPLLAGEARKYWLRRRPPVRPPATLPRAA